MSLIPNIKIANQDTMILDFYLGYYNPNNGIKRGLIELREALER